MPEVESYRIRFMSGILWTVVCTILGLSPETRDSSAIVLWVILLCITTFLFDPEEAKRNLLPFIVRVFSSISPPTQSSLKEEYNPNITPSNSDNICVITQEQIEVPAIVPCCHRSFEREALKRWLNVSSSCPNCRQPVNKVFIRPMENGTPSANRASTTS